MIVDRGLLNKVWSSWLASTSTDPYRVWSHPNDYSKVARRSGAAQEFELWLWGQGAHITRSNKKCFLEFSNEDDATVFILRNN